MPAFLARAIVALTGKDVDLGDPAIRQALAEASGVVVGSDRANPWGLPVSDDPAQCGVTPERALATLGALERVLGCDDSVSVELTWLNEVPFGLFEEAITDISARGGIAALTFDFRSLSARRGAPPPTRRGHHIVRLTPLGSERQLGPTILSPEFRLDYRGALHVFDDSGEISPTEARVGWSDLLLAARSIPDGAIWAVLPSAR